MEQQDKKISQMTQLTNISGDESVPVVRSGGNYRVLVNQIVALARQTMVEAQAGKGLSANDFTDALKAKLEGLSNYDDAEVRSLITAVNGRLDTILGDGASTAIDTFNEIEAFLAGITDTQTLTGLLAEQKQTITAETDDKLAGKVDKVSGKGLSANDYTDEDKAKLGALLGNEQFGYTGHYGMDGKFYTAPNYANSGLIPVNRNFDIEFAANVGGSVASVAFFDGAKRFISAIQVPQTLAAQVLPAADIPEDAVFFIISTATPAKSYYRNGETIESREGAVSEAIQASKLALFVDEFNAAAGSNGKYDPANAPDPRHPFYLNTLWLTYNEAVASMAHINEIYLRGGGSMKGLKIRTNMLSAIPLSTNWGVGLVDLNGVCLYNSIEVLNVGDIHVDKSSMLSAFAYHCDNLHTIIGQISLLSVTKISTDAFRLSPKLQNVRLYNLKVSVSFKDCPLLSLDSIQYMVDNAANTEAITITLHPDAFARLTTELVEAATAKQITFATTK